SAQPAARHPWPQPEARRVIRVAFVSVVPSPYQRDLFAALAARPELAIRVFYMEKSAPDSPWPDQPPAPHESRMPGFWFPLGHARVHVNWKLPRPADWDVIVCNTLMSITGQWLMRARLRRSRWIFWGEKLGARGPTHDFLTAPLRRATAIAAIGTWAEQDYTARFPGTRVFTIPYHCALQPFLEAPRGAREPGTTTFLFCGQMIARKGLDLLLSAFATLPENARLLLVGREAELPAMLATVPRSVRDRIRYAGFQPPESLPRYFVEGDVFVLPSRHDGWGVVVNQALGAGLPVIVSDQVGAGYDLVSAGENGFVFPNGDHAALASAMRRYAESASLCEAHGAASRQRAAGWTPARGAERWLAALKETVA
ncbi:MAG: glycosyltransferase family 4 protein, partial [Chthoniobacteraceae bacterium]